VGPRAWQQRDDGTCVGSRYVTQRRHPQPCQGYPWNIWVILGLDFGSELGSGMAEMAEVPDNEVEEGSEVPTRGAMQCSYL